MFGSRWSVCRYEFYVLRGPNRASLDTADALNTRCKFRDADNSRSVNGSMQNYSKVRVFRIVTWDRRAESTRQGARYLAKQALVILVAPSRDQTNYEACLCSSGKRVCSNYVARPKSPSRSTARLSPSSWKTRKTTAPQTLASLPDLP
jgi:hypothetical protein